VFGHRRQRVSNALHHWLKEDEPADLIARVQSAGIDSTVRPEQLTPVQFVKLAEICGR
jgi:16S rRNA A1518/A1519 N6-dimethyltransferase RsmA/KsgA/DIM1 with predicted DNA glycosylase/AP lyase activity